MGVGPNSLKIAYHGAWGDDNLWTAENKIWSPERGMTGWSPVTPTGAHSSRAPDLDNRGSMMVFTEGSSQTIVLGGSTQPPAEFQTNAKPAVDTGERGSVWLAWRRPDDAVAAASLFDGRWSSPEVFQPSENGPTIAADATGKVVVALRGHDGDNRIYGAWYWGSWKSGPMWPSAGAMLTARTPAVSSSPGMNGFVMAWAGAPGDDSIWWSDSADGANWAAPRRAVPQSGEIRTGYTPGIVRWAYGWALVWRGAGNDAQLYWSVLDNPNGSWATPQPIAGAFSDTGPTLAVYESEYY